MCGFRPILPHDLTRANYPSERCVSGLVHFGVPCDPSVALPRLCAAFSDPGPGAGVGQRRCRGPGGLVGGVPRPAGGEPAAHRRPAAGGPGRRLDRALPAFAVKVLHFLSHTSCVVHGGGRVYTWSNLLWDRLNLGVGMG